MKLIKSLYSITLIALLMLTACQSDNIEEKGGAKDSDGMARITLRIAPDNGKAGTRAWQDDNAKADRTEMMYSWIVLITDGEKIVKKFAKAAVADAKAEIDDVCQNEPIATGNYSVYSFANISEDDLKKYLSVASLNPNTALTNETVAAATATINGNGFVPSPNQGIPMSNKQTLEVPASGSITKDLIVVRMLAKIEVQVFNDGASDATIESISLTDVTANVPANGANNLKLLPNYDPTSGNTDYPDDMNAHHMDIQPNLASGASRGNFTYTLTTDNAVAATGHRTTDGTPDPVIFTFYVNESIAPDNGSQLFYLSLGIKTGTGEDVVYSHALISNTETDEWSYIARNDYRVIPVILTDWLFRVEPLAFVPIAGYPAATVSSDGLKVTYNTGGMIALQPFVKKRTESNWRDFGNADVEFVSLSWKNKNGDNKAVYNSDGTVRNGDGMIVKTAFAYDPVTKSIIGELNTGITEPGLYKTAVTITVKVGSASQQYTYNFTCDVNLQVGS